MDGCPHRNVGPKVEVVVSILECGSEVEKVLFQAVPFIDWEIVTLKEHFP